MTGGGVRDEFKSYRGIGKEYTKVVEDKRKVLKSGRRIGCKFKKVAEDQ